MDVIAFGERVLQLGEAELRVGNLATRVVVPEAIPLDRLDRIGAPARNWDARLKNRRSWPPAGPPT